MSKLKPCPFCGGEVNVISWRWGDIRYWRVECDFIHCPANPRTASHRSEAEAIAAWNTRAVESASGLVYISSFRDNGEFPERIWASLNGEVVGYVRERTCHIEIYPLGLHEEDGEAPICSACRVAIDEDVYYCSNCGARVIGGTNEQAASRTYPRRICPDGQVRG